MVERLDRLTVATAVDASKYTTGAQEKVAADRAMAQSAREVGAAITATDGKINASGDVLSRLSRQYVEGYREQSRFDQGLSQLNRGLETGKISMEGAERILVGMNQRLGLTANVTDLVAKGQVTLASAVERANAQISRQTTNLVEAEAVSRRMQVANSNNRGPNSFGSINAGQQLQDVVVTAMMGQSLTTIGLQQGLQIGGAAQMSGANGVGGLLSMFAGGLANLLSTTNLVAIGITVALAGAIQWFAKGREGAKGLDDVLKGHADTLRLLKQDYGELGEASKSLGTVGGASYTDARARQEVSTLQAAIRSQSGELSGTFMGGGFLRGGLFGSKTAGLDALLQSKNSPFQGDINALLKSIREGNGGLEQFEDNLYKTFETARTNSSDVSALNEELQSLTDAATDAFGVSGKFEPFQSEIDRLLLGLKEGNGDISTFATNVRRVGELNGIQKVADDAILSAKEVVGLAEKLREVQDILQRIDREDTRPGLRDLRTLPAYVNRRDAETRQLDEQAAADRQLARARTNAERMAAIEAQVRSKARQDGDAGGGLQARVDRALAEERNRQEVEARDAALQHNRGLQSSLDQRRLELDLIGRTAGETEKLRFQFERMQELREESARTGSPIDPKEVANIEAAAAAMGKYAEALGRAKLVDDLQFERSQLGRSDLEQSVASQLRGAGLAVDLNGQDAAMVRSNELLKRQVELFKDIRKSGMDAYSDIFDLAFDGFDNWEQRLSDIGKDMAKNLFDLGIKNPFLNEQYGANLPTLSQTGGIGGFFATLMGGTTNPALNAPALQSVGAMTVTAGTVVVSGSIGAGGGDGVLSRIFSPANSNTAGSALKSAGAMIPGIGPLISGAGSLASNTPYSVANATSFIEKYAASIGIDPATALKVARSEGLGAGIWQSNYSKGGFREPSFGPFQLLKGGPGTGFGAGLGNRFMQQTGLDPADPANWQRSTAFALDQAKANGWGSWYGAKNQGITGFMGIDRSAERASGALDNLALGTVDAGKGLNALGGGMGKLGSALGQFPSAPGGSGSGSGFLSGLGKLFGGGLNSMFSGTSAFSWLSSNPGSFIGLYADGTESAPPGWAWVGERGPELMRMRGGETIRSNSRSLEMMGSARGLGTSKTEMHFHNAPPVARQEEADDGEGGKRMDTWFEQQTAKATSRRGSAASKALASMGLTRPMKVR